MENNEITAGKVGGSVTFKFIVDNELLRYLIANKQERLSFQLGVDENTDEFGIYSNVESFNRKVESKVTFVVEPTKSEK